MRDLNSAIEAAKGSGSGALALPSSAVCAPPRSEFWPRPWRPCTRKLSREPASAGRLPTKPTCSSRGGSWREGRAPLAEAPCGFAPRPVHRVVPFSAEGSLLPQGPPMRSLWSRSQKKMPVVPRAPLRGRASTGPTPQCTCAGTGTPASPEPTTARPSRCEVWLAQNLLCLCWLWAGDPGDPRWQGWARP